MYKYSITPAELKEVRKYIIQDIKSDNKITQPITNMTLQDYFRIIMYCMFALTDKKGVVRDQFGETWYSDKRKKDIRKLSSKEIAELWMDGRGLFTKHCNGNNHGVKYGDWSDIGKWDHNQWYHEDRVNDPAWFKQCTQGSIGAGGHPCENIMISNIYPVMYEEDKWFIEFGSRASDYGVLKAYLYLKRISDLPVFIYGAQRYLTKKQCQKLIDEGYISKGYKRSGYYIGD